jgi:hypothetical protein
VKKLAVLAVLALAALVSPAQAKPHKCTPHPVAYVVSGTVQAGTALTQDAKHTYSGTLVVAVTKANHHAKGDKGTTKTYALDHAKVHFGHGVDHNAPAPGSRVHAKGTITTLAKKCDQTGFTPTVSLAKVDIHAAKQPKPAKPAKPHPKPHPAKPEKPKKSTKS